MAEVEEDFSQLPLPDRFIHKLWKVRKEGYEAAAQAFEKSDESDPTFRTFIQDAGIWKGAAGDSNVAAQQEGLAALCAFLKNGGQQASARSRPHTIQPIYEKGLSSTRPAAKANALEALLLYVENDKPELVLEDLLPALSHKQPKVIAASLAAITAIFHNFGIKIVQSNPVLKSLPKVFGHADKNVRAEAQNLTVELYRWLKDAMKPIFWGELKPVQQTDLEKLFEKVKEEPPPKQERLTRAQQAQMATAAATADEEGESGEAGEGDVDGEEPVEIDSYELAEPQDCLSKVPADFNEMINSTKWKERKDTLDALFNVLLVPRIKGGQWDDVIRGLTKSMKDANVAVVTVAANCIEKLANGLRKEFSRYRSGIMGPIMERLKEKKQSVTDALGGALDGIFAATSLTDCLEETLGFLAHKNPNVKGETIKFLVRCLRNTRDVPTKEEQKSIAGAGTKLLTESTEAMRSGGAEILGTLMKIVGEPNMKPYVDPLDDIRKTKIKEYFDAAEVKAKEKPKPKPKPAPAKATSAVGKKVVGKKPVPKKVPSAPLPVEEPEPAPKPTAKALPKVGGLSKPGLAAPSGLKLSGLKKPGLAASPQPKRVISPPMSQDGEDEAPVASPSKFGAGRGLAGRPLSRPVATPMSPPQAPAATGMSAIERAELEELRAEKERLSAIADSLRSSNAKLTAEISELQNQNAQLIEDHTRDVLQIKAKETQLTRARGECDVLRTEMESLKKESERYKREVSRLGRESMGREREDYSQRGRSYDDGSEQPTNGNGVYGEDSSVPPSVRANGRPESRPDSRAFGGLQRTGSGASGHGSRPGSVKPAAVRPASGFTNSSLSPSDEKENNGFESLGLARRKISPPVVGSGGMSSPVRSGSAEGGGSQQGGGQTENWKRAAEVTSQLKARIEAMKVSL